MNTMAASLEESKSLSMSSALELCFPGGRRLKGSGIIRAVAGSA